MKLSPTEFDRKLREGRLRLSVVGMSNVGKTRRAKSLVADQSLNFVWLHGDDLVEAKLQPYLEGKGFKGVNGVAAWMGQPYEARYPETQKLFLQFEESAMAEIVFSVGKNIVVDTTGSVIYLPQNVLQRLKESTLIVYLEATEDVKKLLFERYISNPKPVIWGGSFSRKHGESDLDALRRCYPQLLEYRAVRYRKLADITIPHNVLRDTSGRQFLNEIKKRLPQ
ncbi:hypothetical protein HYU16_02035 [Candidatus Woesearchaeota archaeon]|nr:hypothetical protein [Candidatus Woesearchaeota archaeon]